MSTTYQVGEQTKKKIFEISRQLFYEQGFDETTYDDISKLANINRALIPYYFKNKKMLALLIYQTFIDEYFAICDQALEHTSISDIGRTAFYTFGYYRLLQNRHLTKFLIQFHSDVDYNERMVISKKRFFDILSIKNPSISQSDYEILSQMDYGIEKEIIRLKFYKEESNLQQISEIEFYMILSYLGYPRPQIKEIIKEAEEHLDRLNIIIKERFELELIDNS